MISIKAIYFVFDKQLDFNYYGQTKMLNYLVPLLIVILSFSSIPVLQKEISKPNAIQNKMVSNISVSNLQTKQENINKPNKPPEDRSPTPTGIVNNENPKPTETIIPTITPTPYATPTIHIEEPPDGFIQLTPTPTPVSVFVIPPPPDEIPIDPIPPHPSCYCNPNKEILCLDVYCL
ncbi:MAG: hypothetical protein US39_C0003G0028 [Microgenomates group bacterium GW2011_GWC1_37_12b]|uniref:Uncharacterized protein n=1 Tax=Candidatus Woesebacteria bacterium GW2011_GWB1_38_8b TaxID=1618571 RepID=A0A0G0L585_9BACT|nr:MAG: hypothetical protein US39_C0003G0028 [Microgenomates group bacterium GW2011_GWC1_37_12b]KKQ87133.1 MAG: hypothetical protein UT10_C0010G0008 [Candidatus Woesebacteria bacterium GW2011_GWB1_38_8b]